MNAERFLATHKHIESVESSLDLLAEVLPLLSHAPCGCETGLPCRRELANQKVTKHLLEHLPRDEYEPKPQAAR